MIAAIIIILLINIIYGVFLVTRKISYEIFYEGLVQQTVQDMLKPEYLRQNYKK